MALLAQAGITMLILSTERNSVVQARADKLGVEALSGQDDKAVALARWMESRSLEPARVAYVGNDVNDAGCLGIVGWPVVVANAHPDVKALARITLSSDGGEGAVRELADLVLQAKAKDESR